MSKLKEIRKIARLKPNIRTPDERRLFRQAKEIGFLEEIESLERDVMTLGGSNIELTYALAGLLGAIPGCSCIPDYSERGRADPRCVRCAIDPEAILQARKVLGGK